MDIHSYIIQTEMETVRYAHIQTDITNTLTDIYSHIYGQIDRQTR